jgi:hypothetical protein
LIRNDVSVSFRQWWTAAAAKHGRIFAMVIVGLAGIGIASSISQHPRFQRNAPPSERNDVLSGFHRVPMLGSILEHVSAADSLLSEAIVADAAHPETSRAREIASKMRFTYGGAAIRGADADLVLLLWQSDRELVEHLQRTDVQRCRDFANDRLIDVDPSNETARALFEQSYRASEDVFLNGFGKASQPLLEPLEIGIALLDLGLSVAELDRLQAAKIGRDDDECDFMVRVYAGLPRLEPRRRVAFARSILGPLKNHALRSD